MAFRSSFGLRGRVWKTEVVPHIACMGTWPSTLLQSFPRTPIFTMGRRYPEISAQDKELWQSLEDEFVVRADDE
eukprot:2956283-Karenia_brevis.AAC.1